MKESMKLIMKSNGIMYKIISNIYHKVLSMPYYIFRLFPIDKSKIVFCSYYGNDYGDNPKYIAEEIIRQNLNLDLVWMVNENLMNKNNLPKEIRAVKYGSLKSIYEMVTASVWIDNSRKLYYVKKRPGQYYVQTWHGILPFKKIEKNAELALSPGYIKSAKIDARNTDLMPMGLGRNESEFRNVFWYNGEILKKGIPKLDLYFKENKDLNIKVRNMIGIDIECKILMYAPTFRKDNNVEVYNLDYRMCIEALEKITGEKWKVILRLHPNVAKTVDYEAYNDIVIDATTYPDVQELMAVSDVVITDYSGLMFERLVQEKPCFLYVPDMEEYLKDRGINYELEELPFSISKNNEELYENIIKFDIIKYKKDLKQFSDRHGKLQSGVVSPLILDKIKNVLNISK